MDYEYFAASLAGQSRSKKTERGPALAWVVRIILVVSAIRFSNSTSSRVNTSI